MKYFVTSDIHSFCDELLVALDEAGFDIENPEHFLVVAGDLFDRGPKTVELFNYLMSIPKGRLVLIEGNHELLFRSLVDRSIPNRYDFTNGTVQTICHIAGVSLDEIKKWYVNSFFPSIGQSEEENLWDYARRKAKRTKIGRFVLKESNFHKYFEIGDYIIVHSFIPDVPPEVDWRKDGSVSWKDAEWGCPFMQYERGKFKREMSLGKTLICGHWHAAEFHSRYEGAPEMEDFTPYRGSHLIAIDGCTAYTKMCNVIVIDDSDWSISYKGQPLQRKEDSQEAYYLAVGFGWQE